MLEAVELLDMELVREVFEHQSVMGELESVDSDVNEKDDNGIPSSMRECETNIIKLIEEGEVDDKEPAPTSTLGAQAKNLTEKLFDSVNENNLLINKAGTSRSADYMSMAVTLRPP